MSEITETLDLFDTTGDGKQIPIKVYLNVDTDRIQNVHMREFVTKLEYGNITMTFKEFEKADLGGSQEIAGDIYIYLYDNYVRKDHK